MELKLLLLYPCFLANKSKVLDGSSDAKVLTRKICSDKHKIGSKKPTPTNVLLDQENEKQTNSCLQALIGVSYRNRKCGIFFADGVRLAFRGSQCNGNLELKEVAKKIMNVSLRNSFDAQNDSSAAILLTSVSYELLLNSAL